MKNKKKERPNSIKAFCQQQDDDDNDDEENIDDYKLTPSHKSQHYEKTPTKM